MDDIKKKKEGS